MSIDTCDDLQTTEPIDFEQWKTLRKRISKNRQHRTATKLFGDAAKGGSVYRWGLAVVRATDCESVTEVISRLAVDDRFDKQLRSQVDLNASTEMFVDWLTTVTDLSAIDATDAVIWTAALARLSDELEPKLWGCLFESLLELRDSVLQRNDVSSPIHLMIGVELGLTLSWRCDGLPGTSGLKGSAVKALSQWCDEKQESVSASLEQPTQTRLVLASLIRCKHLINQSGKVTNKRRLTKQVDRVGRRLATWVGAMTTRGGSSAFSSAKQQVFKDDLGDDGLLAAASEFDPECLSGAIKAALGETPVGGRLAWQVTLPEAMHHDSDAKIAVMFPDWDVRRGRTHIDYSGEEVEVEIFSGRTKVIAGAWQTMIETDRAEQYPDGPWSEICEYSDDDVHYLEIEQSWSGGLLLQRQFMLIRDDRCLMLADSIIPQDRQKPLPGSIKYDCRLPLESSIGLTPEPETRDAFLGDGRKRALVIPLSAGEWTSGTTAATIKQSEDGCLVFSTRGTKMLYAPIWFDFQRRRFKRKRTWRQLTIADQLRLVGRDEAVGYRVQVGSEQWVVYRSLADRDCRSFLGKHLSADFFASRFCPEDGGHEALVTVDDGQNDP